jgi:hypothetical protein
MALNIAAAGKADYGWARHYAAGQLTAEANVPPADPADAAATGLRSV